MLKKDEEPVPLMVRITAEGMRAQMRRDPKEFEATLENILATCTDPETIGFWRAVKNFARRSSDG